MDEKTKDLIEKHCILRATVGSQLYGTNLEGSGDRDEMGVYIEPIEKFVGFHEMEHFQYRDATVRTGKEDAPSEPGDLDLKMYGLRKFLRLALKGNPSVIELLFVPPDKCSVLTEVGKQLQGLAPQIVSKRAGGAFLGYMKAQRERLLGERGQKDVNRRELVEKYGYDTKYAAHIIRLGCEGIELLTTGKITLPLSTADSDYIKAVRSGHVSLKSVLTMSKSIEDYLKELMDDHQLIPDEPDEAYVEDWMIKTYQRHWDIQTVFEAFGEMPPGVM